MYYVHPNQFDDQRIKEVDEMIDRYVQSSKSISINNDKTVQWCMDNAYNILSQYYSITKECKLFELYKYELDGERTISPVTIQNKDNIHTFILYTRKDPGINGGNLIIYKGGDIVSVVRPITGTIVCMDDSTYHRAEMMSGMGVKSCVVIQFSKTI
jgi:hypothetical protein